MKEILEQLTLEEKARLCSGKDFWYLNGIERLDVPSIMVTDGPHGLRKQDGASDHVGLNASVKATCFPTASALASSWNKKLLNDVGNALAEECLQEDVSVILGPGMNIKRSPLGGRNFEYFSEDPYLSSEMASGLIDGVQSKGVGTSVKHYVANNQEHFRMTIDTQVDERTLREIYLRGYESVVKNSQPYTIMCSYNVLNGTYVSEHKRVLTDILRDEWGYNGMVVSDWGAVNDRVSGVLAGMDLQMPYSGEEPTKEIIKAVKSGKLPMEQLDTVVLRILNLIDKTKHVQTTDFKYDIEAHHALAKKAAEESVVLLKNESNILPIKDNKKIAIIGGFAKEVRYQGSGSSQINPHRIDSMYDALTSKELFKDVMYASGYHRKEDVIDEALVNEALDVAKEADIVLLFAGLTETYESEGFDRKHLNLPKNHDDLINRVSQVNDHVVVILSNGAPVAMPWIDQVKGVVEGYLAGEAGALAIADIIDGTVCPSGKLAETFPIKLEDTPCYNYFPGSEHLVRYNENLFVGYRYFDTLNVDTLFEFGYGLSYTTFDINNLSVSSNNIDEGVTFQCDVTNTGDYSGSETVQIYVEKLDSKIIRAKKELKAFEKVNLNPKETKTVSFKLEKSDLEFFSPITNGWAIEPGNYKVHIATSVKNTVESFEFIVGGDDIDTNHILLKREHYLLNDSFFKDVVPPKKIGFNTTIGQVKHNYIGKKLYKMIREQFISEMGAEDAESSEFAFVNAMLEEMPLRNIVTFSQGKLKKSTFKVLLFLMNLGKK